MDPIGVPMRTSCMDGLLGFGARGGLRKARHTWGGGGGRLEGVSRRRRPGPRASAGPAVLGARLSSPPYSSVPACLLVRPRGGVRGGEAWEARAPQPACSLGRPAPGLHPHLRPQLGAPWTPVSVPSLGLESPVWAISTEINSQMSREILSKTHLLNLQHLRCDPLPPMRKPRPRDVPRPPGHRAGGWGVRPESPRGPAVLGCPSRGWSAGLRLPGNPSSSAHWTGLWGCVPADGSEPTRSR